MRPPCPVETETASAPPSGRSDHEAGAKLTIGIGALAAPRGPSGTATSVMSPETIARATTSVVPLGRHPLASGLKTCAGSVMVGGDALGNGEEVAAVGGGVLAAAVAVGVGDDAADVAIGGPDDEQPDNTMTKRATAIFLTRGA
jgi:hypothetical protein